MDSGKAAWIEGFQSPSRRDVASAQGRGCSQGVCLSVAGYSHAVPKSENSITIREISMQTIFTAVCADARFQAHGALPQLEGGQRRWQVDAELFHAFYSRH
eukprot:364604-Chlamydomonas_euryale.AAC.14